MAQWVGSLHLTIHTSLSPIRRGFAPGFVNYKKGCTRLAAASDKVYQLLAHGRWFSPASSTTKTGRHDIAEIMLKVALKHLKSNQIISGTIFVHVHLKMYYMNFHNTKLHWGSFIFKCLQFYLILYGCFILLTSIISSSFYLINKIKIQFENKGFINDSLIPKYWFEDNWILNTTRLFELIFNLTSLHQFYQKYL